MSWKDELKILEKNKEWDFAIKLMEEVINHNPHNMDAYLLMNYLLMNLLVEEDYDDNKHDYYASLLLHYFEESYQEFSVDPKYLFYIGKIAFMSEWYFDIEQDQAEEMLDKALLLEPTNLLFQSNYYQKIDFHEGGDRQEEISSYLKTILMQDSSVRQELSKMGSLGSYLWDLLEYWANDFQKRYQVKAKR